jgi:DNA-binding protein HU-beta
VRITPFHLENTMNRTELIDALADRFEMSRRQAGEVVGAIFHPSEGYIAKSLKKGDTVTLTGFGAFGVRKRGARMGRNPQTGESIKVAASKVPGFKAGASLKATVSGKNKAAAKGAGKSAAKGTAKRGR